MADLPTSVRARLWDGPVRVVHWALVVLLGFSWWAAENDRMDWHLWSGCAVLGLVAFRIYWGFVGGGAARFAGFVRGPLTTWRYIRTLPERTGSDLPGHNPLGALSVLAILAALLVQVTTGLFATDIDQLDSGPLSHLVDYDTNRLAAEIHEFSFHTLQVLAAVHVLAVLFYLVWKRSNLIGPMITGRRSMAGDPGHGRAPLWRLAFGVALGATLMVAASKGFWL
ncbi:cytochrome b/b6 domain-containing protein [Phenylobacterium sp.]|uniref:cytochrome b/b6 domain-containing protein n=1 Tax=Phenylobacterium sp. TaxID=1871053 RepID=UPI003983C564